VFCASTGLIAISPEALYNSQKLLGYVAMNAADFGTEEDFLASIQAHSRGSAAAYQRPLEEYLQAVWAEAQEHRKEQASFRLLAEILTNAFAKEPLLFDEQWLAYKSPPKSTLGPLPVENDFEELQQMILYQIA